MTYRRTWGAYLSDAWVPQSKCSEWPDRPWLMLTSRTHDPIWAKCPFKCQVLNPRVGQWVPECKPRTNSVGIIWKLGKNIKSLALLQSTNSETVGGGAGNHSKKYSGELWCLLKFKDHLCAGVGGSQWPNTKWETLVLATTLGRESPYLWSIIFICLLVIFYSHFLIAMKTFHSLWVVPLASLYLIHGINPFIEDLSNSRDRQRVRNGNAWVA